MSWHAAGTEAVLEHLSVDPATGLSREDARARLLSEGPNELKTEAGSSAWQILLGQFTDVLIVILLIATALSALIGELFDAGLILVIVLFSAGLGFIQEYRAERAVEALQDMLSPVVTVLREGEETDIPASELVPGDVILLEAGDRVPTDAHVLDAHTLKTDEAALTGESVPVEKRRGTVSPDARISERSNTVFMGTVVVHGRGRAVAVATGMRTELGKIARDVGAAKDVQTPLERRTAEIGTWLGALALGVVLVVVLAGVARKLGEGAGISVEFAVTLTMFAISLAVAAVPEALAGIVTGTLAVGMQRMARRQALVRKMPAVEALGSVTVVCSDKTGTITKGEMTVRRIHVHDTFVEVTGVGYEPVGDFSPGDAAGKLPALLTAGLLCNDAALKQDGGRWRIHGDPTEGALVVLAAKAGLEVKRIRLDHPRADEVPFSSERKRMTTVHATPGGSRVAFMKGAVEVVLEHCVTEDTPRGARDLTPERRNAILDAADSLAGDGLRALAFARADRTGGAGDEERGMTFLGLVGMIDPARQESIEAVAACRDIGIKPVMITGDHKLTAMAVAREVGIYREGDRALTGAELQALSVEDFTRIVDRVSVYARVSPADKLRIVRAWKGRGEIVAMTGDGVNDAPVLKHADVGVAMGISGTEVAKEAADMVLADDNFATILTAIEMGRWIYDNIKKYLTYLLHANVVEVLVIGGVVLIKGAEYLPLLPAAILFVNLVTDGLPAIALGFSPPEPDIMRRPPRDPQESVHSLEVKAYLLLSLVIAPLFFWAFFRHDDLLRARTDLFYLFVLVELAMALNLCSLRYSLLSVPPHPWLIASVVGSLAVTVVILWSPRIRDAFGIGIPTAEGIQVVLLIPLAITLMSEGVKIALRRRGASAIRR